MKRFLIALAAAVLVFIYLFPYTWMVLSAFRYPADTLSIPPKLVFEISFDGFTKVFRQSVFGLYLLNSLFITACSVAITMLVATPAAYALIRIGSENAKLVKDKLRELRAELVAETPAP